MLWRDPGEYVDTLIGFIGDGLEAGEPVMVATTAEHETWLRAGLAESAGDVVFADITEIGRNPARLIPTWQQFLDGVGRDRPARGVGEPIWPGRRAAEIGESQLHEALVNLAVDPETPFWLVCPYDAGSLDAEVIDEVSRSHPVLIEDQGYHGSTRYGGRAHIEALLGAEFDQPPGTPAESTYRPAGLGHVHEVVLGAAAAAGLAATAARDLATACQRVAAGSLHRGAAGGRLRVWDVEDAVICELADGTRLSDPLAGRRAPLTTDRDGLWFVNQHSDLVRLRVNGSGTAVRIYAWKDGPGAR
jgi:hypothetical protein